MFTVHSETQAACVTPSVVWCQGMTERIAASPVAHVLPARGGRHHNVHKVRGWPEAGRCGLWEVQA